MPYPHLKAEEILPGDGLAGALAGRVQRPDLGGPSVVAIRTDGVFDLTRDYPTLRDLAEQPDPAAALRKAWGERIGGLNEIVANTPADSRNPAKPWLLAPVDLQAIKAAGVTFVSSMLERVIEERARGNPDSAHRIRAEMGRLVGDDLRSLKPGSEEAERLKAALIEEGAWSQYLEVGIGPDAEIFTKAQPMSAVGCGADAGFHAHSHWNNPEPEAVLIVASAAPSSARRSATTSTCAISRAAARCCSARPRTRTRARRWGRSCASSTRPSRSTTCGRWRSR